MNGKSGAGWRLVALTVAGLIVFLLLTAVAGILIAPRWAGTLALRAALAAAGITNAQFAVEHAQWRSLVLSDIALGEGLTARRLEARFGPFGPLGALRALNAEGLRLSGRLGADGLSFGGIERLAMARGTGHATREGGAPPFSVALKDSSLVLDTDFGRLTAEAAQIALDPVQGGRGEAALAIAPPPRADAPFGLAPHRGRLAVLLPPGGALQATLTLAAERGPAAPNLLRVSAAELALSALAAERGALRGRVALKAELDGPAGETLRFENGALALAGRFESDARLSVFADSCAEAHNVRLVLASFSIASAKLDVCPQADGRALFTREEKRLDLSAALPGGAVAVRGASGAEWIAGTLPASSLALTRRDESWLVTLAANGGALTVPEASLSLSALELAGELSGEGGRIDQGALTLGRGTIADIARAPRFAPLSLKGRMDLARPNAVFSLDASVEGVGPVAHITGKHDIEADRGAAELALESLSFAPGALQPEALLPLLRGRIARASGMVAGTARFSWDAEGFSSGASLDLTNLGFEAGFATLRGVEGMVRLSSLFPLRTPAPQEIRIRMMDVGVPLSEGRLRFELVEGANLRVREAAFPFLSGRVFLLPFDLGAGAEERIVLAFDRVDLKALLELIEVKGLTGTGRLTGRVPVVFAGDRQIVKEGHAEAEAPGGTVAYRNPAAAAGAAGSETEILFKALDDFHYSALTVDLAGPLDGDLSLKVHIKGNNPALYGGFPVELNITTEGPFVSMLRRGLYAYRELGRE